MPSVAPANPQYSPGRVPQQDLSQAAAPRDSQSLTNLVRIGVASMALSNSEPAIAQSTIAPNPPPGHSAYVDVQQPNGTTVRVPVVTSIPKGYVAVQGGQLPIYQAQQPAAPQVQQPAAPQGGLPVYTGPAQTQAPVAQTYSPAPANIPTAPQGVMPQGNLQVVQYTPGANPAVGQPTIQTAPAAPGGVSAPGYTTAIPNSYQHTSQPVHGQPMYGQAPGAPSYGRDPRVTDLRTEAEVSRLQRDAELNALRHRETMENIERRRVLNDARTAEALRNMEQRKHDQDYREGVKRTGSWVGGEIFRATRSK